MHQGILKLRLPKSERINRGKSKLGINMNETTSDPAFHTNRIKTLMRELKDHLRADVRVVKEPKAQALFETSAEVLGGLIKAFEDYEQKNEEAWR